MGTLIIGSTAMKRLLPTSREPKDLDVLSDGLDLSQRINGVEIDDAFVHPLLTGFVLQYGFDYATLDELYTIKVSHSYWDLRNGSWNKHMSDIVTLKNAGAVLDLEFHRVLYSVWEETHGKKQVNLQQDKEAFFSDAVKRQYDHDSIHYSVAYGDKPIYESCFKDGQEIEMDMSKIKALPFDQCVRLLREEVYATALERWVIPSGYTVSPRKAYADALKKTITSLTKGWTARFLSEHFETFRVPDMDYVKHHKSKQHLLIELED